MQPERPHKHALAALSQLLAVKAGELAEHQKIGQNLEDDVGSIKRTMRLLDPEADPEVIQPRRRYQIGEVFARGEVTDFILDTLRELPDGEALSASDLAERALRMKGRVPDADRNLWGKVLATFLQQLHALLRRGTVESLGRYRGVMWRLNRQPRNRT